MLDELVSLPLIETFGGIVVPLMFFLTPKDKKSDEDKHGLYPNKKKCYNYNGNLRGLPCNDRNGKIF